MEVKPRDGVFIDVCPACRGVWLDGGELEKILKATRAHEEERLRDESDAEGGGREPPEQRPDERKGRDKKRKGWGDTLGDLLGDIFD